MGSLLTVSWTQQEQFKVQMGRGPAGELREVLLGILTHIDEVTETAVEQPD